MLTRDSLRSPAQFKFFLLAFVCAVACLSLLTAFVFGPPLGHSLPNNLVWLKSFDAAIWRGEIYPRWLPELWFGSGSPDFFFYGPLPFWISSVLGHAICWSCDVGGLLTAGGFIILGLSGVNYFLFASRFFPKEWALVAAGVYMVLPYHLSVDWGLRQAFGEFMSTSIQTGPLIGMQKGPLFAIIRKRPESDARSECVAQQHRRRAPARCLFFEDQARFLKRQLSLPVSMISQ